MLGTCPKCGYTPAQMMTAPPHYPDCKGCIDGSGNLCSDNGGPWYHITSNGAVVPHMPASK